jgi:hypothetical protein
VLSRLDDYDWREAFAYSGVPGSCSDEAYPPERARDSDGVSVAPFGAADVLKAIAVDGENDGDRWLGVFELRDGRFGCLRAGCDFTGWD